MRNDRNAGWRDAGARAAFALVPGGKSPERKVMEQIADKVRAIGADCARGQRAQRCRDVARQLRALNDVVEGECQLDGYKLRMLAAHFEYIAGNIESSLRR